MRRTALRLLLWLGAIHLSGAAAIGLLCVGFRVVTGRWP